MAEFSIKVNQSLVTKTLNQIKPYPYPVFKYPTPKVSEKFKDNFKDGISISYKEMEEYTMKAFRLLQNQGDTFFSKEDINEKYEDNDEIQDIISLIKYKKGEKENPELEKKNINYIEEKKEAVVYATLLSANYIIQNGRLFTAEEDAELLEQAQLISKTETKDIDNFLFLEPFNKGLGSFLKKIWKKGKNFFRRIVKWTRKQLEKIIKLKVELKSLEIEMMERPDFILGNPLKIRNLKLNVRKISVNIRYKLFGKWGRITFTASDLVELHTSAKFGLITDDNKVYVLPKFDKVRFKINLLGVSITIGLTKIVNLILSINGKLLVYDLKNLITPMQVKGLEYSVKENGVDIPQSNQSISMNVDIDIKRKE